MKCNLNREEGIVQVKINPINKSEISFKCVPLIAQALNWPAATVGRSTILAIVGIVGQPPPCGRGSAVPIGSSSSSRIGRAPIHQFPRASLAVGGNG